MGLPNIKSKESAFRVKNINPEVLTNLAHEFLTPLSVISLNIQILERIEESISEEQSQKTAHFIENIKKQVIIG